MKATLSMFILLSTFPAFSNEIVILECLNSQADILEIPLAKETYEKFMSNQGIIADKDKRYEITRSKRSNTILLVDLKDDDIRTGAYTCTVKNDEVQN